MIDTPRVWIKVNTETEIHQCLAKSVEQSIKILNLQNNKSFQVICYIVIAILAIYNGINGFNCFYELNEFNRVAAALNGAWLGLFGLLNLASIILIIGVLFIVPLMAINALLDHMRIRAVAKADYCFYALYYGEKLYRNDLAAMYKMLRANQILLYYTRFPLHEDVREILASL